jgi:hypothetical protein
MQKLKLTALILISIAALSGCSKTETTTTVGEAPPSQSATAAASEDLYSMEYRLCGSKCLEATSQIVTWGKPTEVGIVYYDEFIWNNQKKLAVSMDKSKRNSTYFLVKSKGTAPALKKPLGTERFTPVEVYFGAGPKYAKSKPSEYGRIEIIAIKKILDPTPGKEYLTAMKTLGAKMREPYIIPADRIEGYFSYSLNQPEIKPQQTELITLQEGQSPQIIPVKAW